MFFNFQNPVENFFQSDKAREIGEIFPDSALFQHSFQRFLKTMLKTLSAGFEKVYRLRYFSFFHFITLSLYLGDDLKDLVVKLVIDAHFCFNTADI